MVTAKVSAVVRCHNDRATVARSLASLLAQDLGEHLDIVAVDDASTDDSWDVIRRFERVRAFRLQPNRGATFAAAFGLEKSAAPYFCFVDADDYAEPAMARRLAQALDEKPAASFACCDYFEEDEDGGRRVVRVDSRLANLIACNCMFRRDRVDRMGFWKEHLLLPEYDLAARLLAGGDAVTVEIPLYHYCRRSNSMTGAPGFMDRAIGQLESELRALLRSKRFVDLTFAACRAAEDRTSIGAGG